LKQFVCALVFLCSTYVFPQNISVDSQLYSPQELVEDILINSGCISNISVTNTVSGNFGGNEKSFGYFEGNGSSFPFQSGIVMSTGKLSNVPGPNNSLSDDDASNWGGDNDLEQTLGINNTHNATVIEFDFTPNSDKVRFRYIFASEEYQENNSNTCIYSDVFVFLIKPIGGSYTNIAVVPGTSIPVEVTTVHPEIPGNDGCPAENELYFDSFNGTNSPINFNGQTTPMTAEADVVPGQVYHIKLVIADDKNYRYDSAVFLEAGSFSIGADLGPDKIGADALCDGETYLLQVAPTNQTPIGYAWFKNGILIPAETTDQLLVSNAGNYKVEVDFGNACIAFDEVIIQYADLGGLTNQILSECDANGDCPAVFDLTEVENELLQNGNSLQIDAYFLSENDADNQTNPIPNPTSFQSSQQGQKVYVRVSFLGGCHEIVEIQLLGIPKPKIDPKSANQSFCEGETGIVLQSGLVGDVEDYKFSWNTGETTPTISVNEVGEYSVKITKITEVSGVSYSCSATNSIQVSSSEAAEIKINILGKFGNNSVEIIATGKGDYTYALDNQNYSNQSIYPVSAGSHTAYVKDLNGCGMVSKTFVILDYPKFFTPNNDGTNDYWQLIGTDRKEPQIKSVYIYDRYGKLLTSISPFGIGWDGTYDGKALPSNDYWFRAEFVDGSVFVGHFSLIR
jgi:gliding motility-associated-like protein